MAEGGAAAAMGNVNSNDNWQVHFRDTMRGGKFMNHWRMAELHAKEAPDRVWELETYGALFDRTPDGKISQRNFGGHEYPRLAHVGDRTGLEMIRTLQQKIVSLQQVDQAGAARRGGDDPGLRRDDHHVAAQGRRAASPAPSATPARTARSTCSTAPAVVLATGGIGKTFKVTSNSWEYTGDGHALAMKAGATLLNMEFVQFHPTGMVWPPSVKGILVTESVRGDGGILKNSEGKRFMFDYVPGGLPQAVRRDRGRSRRLVRRPVEQPPSTRAAPARRGRAGDQLRGQGGPWLPRRRRLPRHRVAAARRGDPQEAAVDVPPVQGAGRRRHHGRARWRSVRRATTSWAASRSILTPPRPSCRDCSRPASARAACTGPTGSAATRCPTCWSSAVGPARAPATTSTRSERPGHRSATPMSKPPGRHAEAPFDRDGGENPYRVHADLQQTHERPGGHHPQARGDGAGARPASRSSRPAPSASASWATRCSTPAGTSRSTSTTCSSSRSASPALH